MFILITFIASSGHQAKPLNLELYKLHTKVKIGEKFIVSDLALLNKYVNETFPEAFRTDLDPEEYFRIKSNQSTFEQKLLKLLFGASSSIHGRVKRGIRPSCPVTWVTEYQSTRNPSAIKMAVCNGQGTGCLCEQVTISLPVLRFHGLNPAGSEVWGWEKKSVPVACTCMFRSLYSWKKI